MRDQLQELFQHVLDKGYKKEDRTGVGTISTFGYQCRFNLQEGFAIATTKKTAFKAAVTELIWMIGGWMKLPEYTGVQRTNIKFLLDNKVKIWTEWPYKAYKTKVKENNQKLRDMVGLFANGGETVEPVFDPEDLTQAEFEDRIRADKKFAIEYGDLGPVYQKQWRDFEGKKEAVDQLMTMINRLKSNPDCRRNLSSYWNPTELGEMLLPPCHLLHQVWTRPLSERELAAQAEAYAKTDTSATGMDYRSITEHYGLPVRAISLQMYQRSSDCFLGVPFDWVFYSLLTHMLAELSNMVVDEFIWVSGDTHLYLNSINEAKEVLTREPYPYPKLIIKNKRTSIEDFVISDFALDNYQHHAPIKVAVAV
jgi:thymidylate synthase